jgi:nucleotide-binding universal stress UspA family protein
MENIIVILDAAKPRTQLIEFSCYIANLSRARLSAYFIERVFGNDVPRQKLLFALPYVDTITSSDLDENNQNAIRYVENEKAFCDACMNRGVTVEVIRNRQTTLEELIIESRFAELIILDPEISFGSNAETVLSREVEEFIHQAECPVMVAPYNFYGIDEIIFTYDGSKSSVFAIKRFIELFPELSNLKATALQIAEGTAIRFRENTKVMQLIASQFPNVKFRQLTGKASDQLFSYLIDKNRTALVLGAYGRGFSSMMFKPSIARLIVKTLNLPVFISHPN